METTILFLHLLRFVLKSDFRRRVDKTVKKETKGGAAQIPTDGLEVWSDERTSGAMGTVTNARRGVA